VIQDCCHFNVRVALHRFAVGFRGVTFTPPSPYFTLVALTAGCRNLLQWFGKRVSHFPRNGPAIFPKVRRDEGVGEMRKREIIMNDR